MRNQQQAYPGQFPGYQVPAPTGQQVPVHVGPPAQQAITRQPPNQPVIQAYPAPERYQYGWLSDPLYYTMQASPPPMRPQLQGESFMERLMKNMMLDAGASAAANIYWAIRQAVLAPSQPEPIDVGPMPPTDPNKP